MSFSDPVGDMLTRIRNGKNAGKGVISSPDSKFRRKVLEVLKKEGYIRGYEVKDVRLGVKVLDILLKTNGWGIQEIKRVSKPGCRVYVKNDKIPRVKNGLGVSILSTSRGVMSNLEAYKKRVGGEILCHVF